MSRGMRASMVRLPTLRTSCRRGRCLWFSPQWRGDDPVGLSHTEGVSMVQGIANKILRVNLTNRQISVEGPDELFYRKYLGGAGFVTYYLLKELKPGTDPLSPDNILIFALGPMTGTAVPGASRNCIGAKSPLSGGIAKSEVGGHFGYELKRAGFDSLIVEGRAESPVYLWIHNEIGRAH